LGGARYAAPGAVRQNAPASIPAQDGFCLPKAMRPAPERYSFVIALDPQARVVQNLQNGSSDCYAQIANVLERDGKLYFGSIGEDTVGRFGLLSAPHTK